MTPGKGEQSIRGRAFQRPRVQRGDCSDLRVRMGIAQQKQPLPAKELPRRPALVVQPRQLQRQSKLVGGDEHKPDPQGIPQLAHKLCLAWLPLPHIGRPEVRGFVDKDRVNQADCQRPFDLLLKVTRLYSAADASPSALARAKMKLRFSLETGQ